MLNFNAYVTIYPKMLVKSANTILGSGERCTKVPYKGLTIAKIQWSCKSTSEYTISSKLKIKSIINHKLTSLGRLYNDLRYMVTYWKFHQKNVQFGVIFL